MKLFISVIAPLLFATSAFAQTSVNPLCDAIKNHDLAAVRSLLENKTSPNILCGTTTPLYYTLTMNSPESSDIARALIAYGENAQNVTTLRGSWSRRTYYTDFEIACLRSASAVEAFIDKGVDPSTVSSVKPGVKTQALSLVLYRSTYDVPTKIHVADLLLSKGVSPFLGNNSSYLDFFLTAQLPVQEVLARLGSWDFSRDQKSPTDYLLAALARKSDHNILTKLVDLAFESGRERESGFSSNCAKHLNSLPAL